MPSLVVLTYLVGNQTDQRCRNQTGDRRDRELNADLGYADAKRFHVQRKKRIECHVACRGKRTKRFELLFVEVMKLFDLAFLIQHFDLAF